MRGVASEFRKGAEGHSEEGTDKIVDKAVTAVRSEKRYKRGKLGAKA